MKLITAALRKTLLANGALAAAGEDTSHLRPPLKLFAPWGAATWLISEIHPGDPDILFGLADLGFGTPELGSISLRELEAARGPFRMRIERDLHFKPKKSLADYAAEARAKGRIAA